LRAIAQGAIAVTLVTIAGRNAADLRTYLQ
jgi:hypothetical protein